MATEKRLIDANALLKALGYDPMKFWTITPESTFGIVLNAPTVDAVEVVRCKDCKYFEMNPFDGCEVCTHISGYVRPDFGCVDGERKDND